MALGTGTITEPGAESLIELEVGLVIKPGVRPTMKLKSGASNRAMSGAGNRTRSRVGRQRGIIGHNSFYYNHQRWYKRIA